MSRFAPLRAVLCVVSIACAALLGLAAPARSASPVDDRKLDRTKFIPVEEIKPGQVATCRTVFQGRTIETFELDIVGVLPGGRTDGDMILARARGERLTHQGIAAGMSGSPVYIDGRLAGALAFGWSFSRDPLCGITPIAEMLDVLDHPECSPAGDFGSGGAVPLLPRPQGEGEIDSETPSPPASAPAGRAHQIAQLRTPLVVSGLTPQARDVLVPWADQMGFVLAPGGAFSAQAPGGGGGGRGVGAHSPEPARLGKEAALKALEPGASIAVDLIRGDLNASAIGTLTWREGDKVLAFGHPFFQSGEVKMPLSLSDITTIVASDLNSFKMGVAAEQVGTISQDRRAGIGGAVGEPPAMLPVTVKVKGDPGEATYHFQILRHRGLAAQLVSLLALNSTTARGGLLAEATWRYRFALAMPGRAPVELEDVGSGTLGTLMGSLTQPLQLLLNNPFAPLDADSLTLDLTIAAEMARAQIWSARLEPRVVRPGERVKLWVETHDWRGQPRETALELDVPSDQPEGRFVVVAAGGADLDRSETQRLPTRHRASSLAELIERLGDRRKVGQLYGVIYGPGVELNLGGHTYPDLPSFAQQVLASDREARPASPWGRLDRVAETSKSLGAPVLGVVTLALDVRNRPNDRTTPRPAADRAQAPLFRATDQENDE